jgi:hypothetical protein
VEEILLSLCGTDISDFGRYCMPILSIFVEDKQRAIEAITYAFRYSPTIDTTNEIIPNPETPEQFTNKIIQAFIIEHIKAYEVKIAADAASEQVIANFNYSTGDGSEVKPYRYYMVCETDFLDHYNLMASALVPGSHFNIPLVSMNTEEALTHYGLSADITEEQRIKLNALEMFGGTGSGTYPSLLYVRCDSLTDVAQITNVDTFDKIGQTCSFDDFISSLGLKRE